MGSSGHSSNPPAGITFAAAPLSTPNVSARLSYTKPSAVKHLEEGQRLLKRDQANRETMHKDELAKLRKEMEAMGEARRAMEAEYAREREV